jgi:peptidoglycan-associated lipoprotein
MPSCLTYKEQTNKGDSMKKMVQLFLLPIMILSLLSFSACSSKKKKKSLEDGVSSLDGMSDLGSELTADSDSGRAAGLQSVYFAYDSASLSSSTKAALAANAQILKATPMSIQIEGHCDERGGVQYNIALGEKRARAVRDYLVTLGVDRSKLSVISFGKERPITFGHDESAWSKNRRANFVITLR